MRNATRHTLASVQQQYVHAREVLEGVLCVQSATSPTRRVYRAVLEVPTLNLLLKAEEEQDALIERYRSILKALTFPVQILVRNQRLDMRPAIARIQDQIPRGTEGRAWSVLAEGLTRLLDTLGRERTLTERHCYLVIPAPDLPLLDRHFWSGKRHRRAQQTELLARALQELRMLVETLQQQLASLGLRAVQLTGVDLATLYYRCLTPECALQHPLQREHLAAIGRVPRLVRRLGGVRPCLCRVRVHPCQHRCRLLLRNPSHPPQHLPTPAPLLKQHPGKTGAHAGSRRLPLRHSICCASPICSLPDILKSFPMPCAWEESGCAGLPLPLFRARSRWASG